MVRNTLGDDKKIRDYVPHMDVHGIYASVITFFTSINIIVIIVIIIIFHLLE